MQKAAVLVHAIIVGVGLTGFAGCEPEPECRVDADCPGGSVCELSTGCEAPSQCVVGCHDDSQCQSGESCNQVQCFTCPCPGICEAPTGSCSSDSDCPTGTVCELSTGCTEPSQCVTGCRDDSGCGPGEVCDVVQCITCPCPGLCL
jgi:Cys-rich repeat protein